MHFESSYDLIWFSTIYWCSKGSLNLWTNYSLTLTVDNYIIIWSHNTDKHGYGSQEPGILFPQPRFWPANKPMVSQFNLIICFCPGKLGTKPDSLTRCWDVYPKGENSDYTAVNPSNFCLIISSPDFPVHLHWLLLALIGLHWSFLACFGCCEPWWQCWMWLVWVLSQCDGVTPIILTNRTQSWPGPA